MPWLEDAQAVLMSWYGGMESGNALARVIFGDVNPSGKLPCTFPRQLSDSPAHAMGNFPGADGVVKYEEGLLVGYRYFDSLITTEPLFPFGFGLSYTTFHYSNLIISPSDEGAMVRFDLTNIGPREGAEAAQVYVEDVSSSLPRPLRELKGVSKISLKPGETKKVVIPLTHSSFAFYDPAKSAWVAEAGEFVIHIGGSSRNLPLRGSFSLGQTIVKSDDQ